MFRETQMGQERGEISTLLFIRRVQTASAVERKKGEKERTCGGLIY